MEIIMVPFHEEHARAVLQIAADDLLA
jgi:hypothetical protein